MKRTHLHFAEKFKKPLHILTAFAVIICTAFSVPVFAQSLNEYTFENSNLPNFVMDTSNYTNGLNIYTNSAGTTYYYASADNDATYSFILNTNYIYYVSKIQNTKVYTRNSQVSGVNEYTLSLLEDTDYYINVSYNNAQVSKNLPKYNSLTDALSDFDDYILNNESSAGWVNKPLVIPQGYTAVINTTNMTAGKGGFRLRANTGNLGNSNLWRDIFGNDNVQSGQAIYNTNTPVTSYDFDDYPQLTWSPYEYSLLRATAYEYIGEATKANTYTYIFNPIQGNATSIKNGQNTNSYITLYMNDQFDGTVKLYPLTSMAAVGQGQTIDVGNDESENAGSGDISNGTWTNSDGNVFTPPQGGGNGAGSSQNPLEAISSTVEHLGEVLNQFVAGLSTILTAPVEAIQTLINNGSAFVSQLSGLYSWLPAQVYSTLTSAIILCITVGVLKVLL